MTNDSSPDHRLDFFARVTYKDEIKSLSVDAFVSVIVYLYIKQLCDSNAFRIQRGLLIITDDNKGEWNKALTEYYESIIGPSRQDDSRNVQTIIDDNSLLSVHCIEFMNTTKKTPDPPLKNAAEYGKAIMDALSGFHWHKAVAAIKSAEQTSVSEARKTFVEILNEEKSNLESHITQMRGEMETDKMYEEVNKSTGVPVDKLKDLSNSDLSLLIIYYIVIEHQMNFQPTTTMNGLHYAFLYAKNSNEATILFKELYKNVSLRSHLKRPPLPPHLTKPTILSTPGATSSGGQAAEE